MIIGTLFIMVFKKKITEMKYLIAHPYDRTWVGKTESGWDWVEYEKKFVFQNGIHAKEALSTIPPIRDSYNAIKKPHWMNVTGLKGF